MQPNTVRNENCKKIKGSLIFKTDTGPGCLCNEESHIKFHEEMLEKGVHIMLGLPNGTECMQEMDQAFAEFKRATDKSALWVAATAIAKQVEARKIMRKRKAEEEGRKLTQNNHFAPPSSIDNLLNYFEEDKENDLDDGEEEDVDEEENYASEIEGHEGNMSNVKIDNFNLSAIVNGNPGDLIELWLFDKIFTCANIWKWRYKVEFISMSRNALNDYKVHQQLGGEKAAVGNQGEINLFPI